MGWLDRFLKKPESAAPRNAQAASNDKDQIKKTLDALVQVVWSRLQNNRGVHVEDAISLAATMAAERCIDAAGDFDLRNHSYPPGQRVFSDKVNELLVGNVDARADQEIVPGLYSVVHSLFTVAEFPPDTHPSLRKVFGDFAARVGDASYWGKVPLSIPESHWPHLSPLQVGFETRKRVDETIPANYSKREAIFATTSTLIYVLRTTRTHLVPKIAMTLAVETVVGMAKTAPMTERAFAELQKAQATK